MGLHFFIIPVAAAKESEAELNKFISQNQIVNIENLGKTNNKVAVT